MFKIGKLEKVDNEKVNIQLITQEEWKFKKGKKESHEKFKTLSIEVEGKIADEEYKIYLEFNCKLEKLLELPSCKTVDFSEYVFLAETWLNIRDNSLAEVSTNVKINRYLKNKFILFITFYTEHNYFDDDNYSGIIEISFNLDDYLQSDKS